MQESFSLGVAALMLEGIPESSTPILLSKTGADPAQAYLVSPQKGERGLADEVPAKSSVVNNVHQQLDDTHITAGNSVEITGVSNRKV